MQAASRAHLQRCVDGGKLGRGFMQRHDLVRVVLRRPLQRLPGGRNRDVSETKFSPLSLRECCNATASRLHLMQASTRIMIHEGFRALQEAGSRHGSHLTMCLAAEPAVALCRLPPLAGTIAARSGSSSAASSASFLSSAGSGSCSGIGQDDDTKRMKSLLPKPLWQQQRRQQRQFPGPLRVAAPAKVMASKIGESLERYGIAKPQRRQQRRQQRQLPDLYRQRLLQKRRQQPRSVNKNQSIPAGNSVPGPPLYMAAALCNIYDGISRGSLACRRAWPDVHRPTMVNVSRSEKEMPHRGLPRG